MSPDTRTRLILAAMDLFWEKGYASTSMADVLRRADVHVDRRPGGKPQPTAC